MKLPDVLLLFIVYTLVVAAGVGAYVYFLSRRPRPKQSGLAIPNVSGMNVKRAEGNIVAWPLAEPVAAQSDEETALAEPVNVSPPGEAQPSSPPATRRIETLDAAQLPAGPEPSAAAITPKTEMTPVSSLAGVFESERPLLPEGLRTLEVLPNRIVQPGTTVRAAFTFRNLGGNSASGFRVRFRLPDGLTYIAGSARIDETPLEDQDDSTALLQSLGADIGEIPAGGERRVSLGYTVAATIENGTPVTLQAAVASQRVPVIGSNVVRLVVRSLPVLENPQTTLVLEAIREALPGEELQFNARIHNSGQSSAHDLVVLLPLPANTTLVPQSATVDGRTSVPGSENISLGFTRPTVVAPRLEPGATIDIGYRVRIDTPLEDATQIIAGGAVCCQEVAEFSLPPVSVKIPSAASFAGEETSFRIECEDYVEPGESVRLSLYAKNVGTASARKLSLRIALPEGMLYTAGSLAIDGAPAPDRGALPDAIRLGDLEPGRSVEMALSAIVHSPIADGHELRLGAAVVWSKGQRRFEKMVTAKSAPRFPVTFNRIERETPRRVGPGDPVSFTIALLNMGTDVATGAHLQITADEGIQHLRLHDRDAQIEIGPDGTIALDPLEPGVSRSLRVDGQVAPTIEDQTQLRLHATLLTPAARIELGAPIHVVDSRPRFAITSSHVAPSGDEPLRLRHVSAFRLTLANEGTDCGRDVRVALELPEELQLEEVDAATRDGNVINFGDIPAGQTREAVLHVRLISAVTGDEPLTIAAHVHGLNVVPFGLNPIELVTHAEASFAEATLKAVPSETVDAGAQIAYTLTLRNVGDGAAKLLTAHVATLTNAVYAQGSTTVNGIALQDRAGTSLLFGEEGLRLADVGAGVEVVAYWRAIVNTPLPPSAMIQTAVAVRWDEAPEITVSAASISVRSTSALPIIEPELPFSVLGAVAAPARATAAARPEMPSLQPGYATLRPAVPVRRVPTVSSRDSDPISATAKSRPPGTDESGESAPPEPSA